MKLNKVLSFLMLLCASAMLLVQCKKEDISPIDNKAPIASAGADQIITLPINIVKLDGSASKGVDGKINKYEWVKIAGPTAFKIETPAKDTTTVSELTEGAYSFKLTVTDDKGLTNSDTVKVIVNKVGAQPPVANAGQPQTITLPTNMVILDGSLSRDRVGSQDLAYKWEYLAGGPNTPTIATSDKVTTQVTGLIEGIYTFQLTVTQNNGLMHSTTVKVTVNKAGINQLPVANAGKDQIIALPTNIITLDGSTSNDPDGTIKTYTWTYVTGGPAVPVIQNANTVNPTIPGLSLPGDYGFALTITDDKGASNSDTVNIKVILQGTWITTAGKLEGKDITKIIFSAPIPNNTMAITVDYSSATWENIPANYLLTNMQMNGSFTGVEKTDNYTYTFISSFNNDYTKLTITSFKLKKNADLATELLMDGSITLNKQTGP